MSQSGHEADAQAVLKMCAVFHAGEYRLAGNGDEVKTGRIELSQANSTGS